MNTYVKSWLAKSVVIACLLGSVILFNSSNPSIVKGQSPTVQKVQVVSPLPMPVGGNVSVTGNVGATVTNQSLNVSAYDVGRLVQPFDANLVATLDVGVTGVVAPFNDQVPNGKLLVITHINGRFQALGPNDQLWFTLWTNPQAGQFNAQTDFAPSPIAGIDGIRLLNEHVELFSYGWTDPTPLKVTIVRSNASTSVLCQIRVYGYLVDWK